MMKIKLKLLTAALAMASLTAQAQLGLTGPGSVATGGFPKYYQDTNGLALDICLPKPGLERTPIRCIMADLPNPNAAISFPNNFPDEAFWWTGETNLALDIDNGVQKEALLVMAVEAAFANELPAEGDQVAFTRIRLRINDPTPGHYKVTHPYGTEEFDVAVGDRRVFITDDFGDLTGQDFTRAGKGRLGPFLTPVNNLGEDIPPFDVVLEDGTVRQYIADPADDNLVKGSPNGTNYFQIEITPLGGGVAQSFRTDTFNVGGRIYNGPLDSDTNIMRASYSQDATSGDFTIDVHVKAAQALGQTAPNFKAFADGIPGTTLVKNPNNPTDFFGKIKVANHKPNNIYVSDLREDPDRLFSAKLVDVVTVNKAVYNAGTGKLHIEAESSDKSSSNTGSLPTLTASGSDGSSYGDLVDGVLDVDATIPPEKVIVRSTENGVGELAVVTAGAPLTAQNLAANNDGGTPGTIDVLTNDATTGPVQVNIVQEPYPNPGHVVGFLPQYGTVAVNGDNTVTYTQTKPGTGHDNFSYYLTDVDGNVSNIATVDVNLGGVLINLPPVATADFASVSAGSSVTIDVLDNDSDPEGSVLTIMSVSDQTDPNATISIVDGKIVYTASAAAGQQSFTYTINDAGLAQATGTVTITVTQPITVGIQTAEYRTGKAQWRVSGTVNPAFVGMTVKVYRDVNPNNVLDIGVDQLIGETLALDAADAAAGVWDFRSTTGPVAANGWRILAVSSLGGAPGVSPLTVRR